MERKVFVVFSDGRRDFFKAERFGEIVTVMDSGYDSQYRDMNAMVDYIRERLENYHEDDYILMVGEPTLCALVTNVAVELSLTKRVNILRWDKIHMSYQPVCVDFSVIRETQSHFKIK